MAILACAICGENENQGRGIPNSVNSFVDCPKCGSFELNYPFETDLRGQTALKGKRDLLPYLSAYIRQARDRGPATPSISSDNWEDFAKSRSSTPLHERAIRLLSLLASRGRPGAYVTIDGRLDAPLLDCFDSNEVDYLIAHLVKSELIEESPPRMGRPKVYAPTMSGWTRLDPGPGGQPGRGFVAMSFKPDMDNVWSVGMQPAIEGDCRPAIAVRLDKTEHNEKICDKILVEIRLAEFLVADVTHQSPGVYFEAGFAMALGRPVIWTCREDDFDNAHFDTRQYNHIVWKEPADLRRQLAIRIKATVPSAIKRNAP